MHKTPFGKSGHNCKFVHTSNSATSVVQKSVRSNIRPIARRGAVGADTLPSQIKGPLFYKKVHYFEEKVLRKGPIFYC